MEKKVSWKDGDFKRTAIASTEYQVVKSQFGDNWQLMVTTTVKESWEIQNSSNVSSLFGATASGDFDEKKYIAWRNLNANISKKLNEASNEEREELIARIIKLAEQEKLYTLMLTSSTPIKDRGTEYFLEQNDGDFDAIIEAQEFATENGTFYNRKYVVAEGKELQSLADYFDVKLSKEDLEQTGHPVKWRVASDKLTYASNSEETTEKRKSLLKDDLPF